MPSFWSTVSPGTASLLRNRLVHRLRRSVRQAVPGDGRDDAGLGVDAPNAVIFELGNEQVSFAVHRNTVRGYASLRLLTLRLR